MCRHQCVFLHNDEICALYEPITREIHPRGAAGGYFSSVFSSWGLGVFLKDETTCGHGGESNLQVSGSKLGVSLFHSLPCQTFKNKDNDLFSYLFCAFFLI